LGIVAKLLSAVTEYTSKLDALAERGLMSWVEELAALHALQLQSQALLDLVVHIAAELGYAASTPRDAARYLLDEGLLTSEEYQLVRRVAAFRNIIVHEYVAVDMDTVRRIVEAREYRKVALLAAKLAAKASERGIDP
jgi:uncharacterized protein YutE (UPF0331/DUF86 family)